jgi:hypothetical protein
MAKCEVIRTEPTYRLELDQKEAKFLLAVLNAVSSPDCFSTRITNALEGAVGVLSCAASRDHNRTGSVSIGKLP